VVDCEGKACGSDGCGGVCGTCFPGTVCSAQYTCIPTNCVPACAGRECGDDGCAGSCGECAGGAECSPKGVCLPAGGDSDVTEPSNPDTGGNGITLPEECPEGYINLGGSCVEGDVEGMPDLKGSDCSARPMWIPGASGAGFGLLSMLLLGLLVTIRGVRAIRRRNQV